MLEKPNFSKFHQLHGALLIVFNAFLLDLLLVGYGGAEDGANIGKLLGAATLGGVFETTLVVCFLFFIYSVLLKEPLVRALIYIYFPVVYVRNLAYPLWYTGYSGKRSSSPLRTALDDWRRFVRYQLDTASVGRKWTALQQLSVATFFLFLISMAAPFWGFNSIGYRILPEILAGLGVPEKFHWVGLVVFGLAICYMCSNGMLALFGDHSYGFSDYETKLQNKKFIEVVDKQLTDLEQKRSSLAGLLDSDEQRAATEHCFNNLIGSLRNLRGVVAGDMDGDHSEFIWRYGRMLQDSVE